MRAARRRLSGNIVALLILTGAVLAIDPQIGVASAATVVIDPGSYTGRYFISTTGYGAEYHGQQSFDLAAGQTYWIHQGASEFYFQVTGDGQVTSLSPAATGSGNRLVFNTVPVDHDVTNEMAAYKLADAAFPGYFGIFYNVNRPTKNALEAKINADAREKVKSLKDWQILQKNFDRMK